MTDHYDVIVIGSGAGGGTLTHALAPTGQRILLLERGGFLPREPQNWDSTFYGAILFRFRERDFGSIHAPSTSIRCTASTAPTRTTRPPHRVTGIRR